MQLTGFEPLSVVIYILKYQLARFRPITSVWPYNIYGIRNWFP